MLARDLVRALDPVVFARDAGIEPDPWQERVLRSASPRILLNCSRQSGKSTVTSLLAMHVAIYEPGSLVLLLSPTLRQSSELFRKVLDVYRALGRPVTAAQESSLRLELDGGSRIVSLPGTEKTIRGYSGVRLLCLDEAARIPGELYATVRPMLAVSGGRLVALSTPWGSRGWFYEAWRGEDAWERVRVPASECPRISSAFLAEEERSLGAFWFRQEYQCEFLDAQSQAFRREDVDRAFEEEVATWEL